MGRQSSDPKARLDEALRTQRQAEKHGIRRRRRMDEESSVIRTFVAWVRGGAPDEVEDSAVRPQIAPPVQKRPMGVLVLITAMLAAIVILLIVVALRLARQG